MILNKSNNNMANYKHVCGSCHNDGWMKFASTDNPARDDWCVICEHYSWGLKRNVIPVPWDMFMVPPDDKSDDTIILPDDC